MLLTFGERLLDCPLKGGSDSCSLQQWKIVPLFSCAGIFFFFYPRFPFIASAVFISAEKFKMLAARVDSADIPDIEGQRWKES